MAGMGYAAFALDYYGKGRRCTTSDCASNLLAEALSDIPKLRRVISAGTSQLLQHADKSQLVAFGYCAGGAVVLELARHPNQGASNGVSYLAVSSMHGVLSPYNNETAAQGEISARVQVNHAELDFQGESALDTLRSELKVGVDGSDGLWDITEFAKVQHGWTLPGTPIYDARASVQAHKSMFEFFNMALGIEDPDDNAFPTNPVCDEQVDKQGAAPDMDRLIEADVIVPIDANMPGRAY